MRQIDEMALWTSRDVGVRVRYAGAEELIRGVRARTDAAHDASDGGTDLEAADVAGPGTPEPSDHEAEVPWRLRVLNTGRVKQIRRWIYHARRAPAHAASARVKRLLRTPARWSETLRRPLARARAAAPALERAVAAVATPAPAAEPTGEPMLADLRAALAERPSASALHALVAALYRDGQLRAPAAALEEHPELVGQFTPAQAKLARNVREQARLLDHPPVVPARAVGTALRPEAGRILYCAHGVHPYQSNGYAIRTRGIVAGLRDAGHDVVVAARPGFPWDAKVTRAARKKQSYPELVDGIEHVYSFGPSLRNQALAAYLESAVDSYLQVIARNRPAHVHAASNHITALPALIAARLSGLPFTYEVRGFWEYGMEPGEEGLQERGELAGALEDLVMAEADHVFVLTSEMRDELRGRGVDPDRMTVTPNGVDPEQFQPLPAVGELHRRLGLDPDRAVIGYMGSLVSYEGLEDLLEACLQLAEERDDFQIVVAGDGPVLPRLKEIVAERDTSVPVHLLGRIDADLIPALMSEVDVVACPRTATRVTRLVSPLKPLEALAAGVPVVLSDLPVLRSLAEECGGAVVFPAGDRHGLAEAIAGLLDDPARRLDLGRSGRAWALRERRWDVLGAQLGSGILAAVPSAGAEGGSRPLSTVRLGVIADTFTTSGLAEQVQTVPLQRAGQGWRRQLAEDRLDAVFVESAWSGNDGAWTRGVGHYSDEESADLRALLEDCRAAGVPTVFWNKEDPVHFNRFVENARLFDLVLTTDNRSIQGYQARVDRSRQTVGSMAFFAQPSLHHPVTDGPAVADRPVMYAGSYYGGRYRDRSEVLRGLLHVARPFGVTIYDRQADLPDSPYRFPEEMQPFVEGGLPYSEMVKAYRRYPLHVNVNSVTASETMFSRRVMEISCAGGVVASGPSAGVNHMFRGLVPTIGRREVAERAMYTLLSDPGLRNVQGWNLRRLVRRSHTLSDRLLVLLRRLGLAVSPDPTPGTTVVLTGPADRADWDGLLAQTRPVDRVVADEMSEAVRERLSAAGIEVSAGSASLDPAHLAWEWDGARLDRVVHEDLADVLLDSGHSAAVLDTTPVTDLATPLAVVGGAPVPSGASLVLRWGGGDGGVVTVRRGLLESVEDLGAKERPAAVVLTPEALDRMERPLRVVVAGHDLKFAGELINRFRSDGHEVRLDQWASHQDHDEGLSRELVDWADVVLCEWGLGNAVWYSMHKREGQRLYVRVHSQELFRDNWSRMNLPAVDRFIFVAPHIRDSARRFRGVAARPAEVIPNIVLPGAGLKRDPDSRFVLGLVGIVPRGKRFDRALDLLAMLRREDPRYSLRVKGKQPEDYPWMAAREEEMAYYGTIRERIAQDPALQGAVHLDGFSTDRAELERWYSSIGIGLSVSDFESFHFTSVDGAQNGAVPAVLAWPGADRMFPAEWLSPTLESMARRILGLREPEVFRAAADTARRETSARFDGGRSLDRWSELVAGE